MGSFVRLLGLLCVLGIAADKVCVLKNSGTRSWLSHDGALRFTLNAANTEFSVRQGQGCPTGTLRLPESFSPPEGDVTNCSDMPVTGIDGIGFQNCASLNNVTIEYGYKSIVADSFKGCSLLAAIHLPPTITTIGTYAFSGCEKLTEVEIPRRVSELSTGLFSGCTALQSVIILGSIDRALSGVFANCPNLKSITYGGLYDILDRETGVLPNPFTGAITVSGTYNDIKFLDYAVQKRVSSYSDAEVSIVQTDKTLTITGIGGGQATEVKRAQITPFCYECIETVIVDNEIEIIGSGAFKDCTGLVTLRLTRDSTRTILENAFSGCTSLESVTLNGFVATIGANAFRGCTALKNLAGFDNVGTYGNGVLAETRVKSYYFGYSGFRSIPDRMFEGCTELEIVKITAYPKDTWSVGNGTFDGCAKLRRLSDVDITADIVQLARATSFGDRSFYGCRSIKTVYLCRTPVSVLNNPFSECSALTAVYVPVNYNGNFGLPTEMIHRKLGSNCEFAPTSPFTGSSLSSMTNDFSGTAFFTRHPMDPFTLRSLILAIGRFTIPCSIISHADQM